MLGVLGTGTLVFFLDPIQRAAEGFSNAAMPNTVDTPEYESFRKLQVYDSAIRAALEARGDARSRVLVPESAHGTNPATAALCGYKVDPIPANERGRVDIDALKGRIAEIQQGANALTKLIDSV